MSNLRQLSIAVLQYAGDNADELPSSRGTWPLDGSGGGGHYSIYGDYPEPGISYWPQQIRPYLNQNRNVFHCECVPKSTDPASMPNSYGDLSYVYNGTLAWTDVADDGVAPDGVKRLTMADRPSETILFSEWNRREHRAWLRPNRAGKYWVTVCSAHNNLTDGACVMLDGSVRVIRNADLKSAMFKLYGSLPDFW